jgi:hypothetical protein
LGGSKRRELTFKEISDAEKDEEKSLPRLRPQRRRPSARDRVGSKKQDMSMRKRGKCGWEGQIQKSSKSSKSCPRKSQNSPCPEETATNRSSP